MTPLLALVASASLARAGLLEGMTDEERRLHLCVDAAYPLEQARSWGVAAASWERCAAELEALGAHTAVRSARDQAAVLRALAAHEGLRAREPGEWGARVLAVAASQDSVTYPTPVVLDAFRAWVASEPGKARVEDVRTVTVGWLPGDPWERADRTRFAELFRRYAEDAGLRWADPGSPDVDVIVRLQITRRDLEPRTTARMGSLARVEQLVRVADVRFVRLDRTADGFASRVSAEAVRAEDAGEEALRAAMDRTAAKLLKTILREAFAAREETRPDGE
jgi:hypothetical protein